MRQLKCSRWTRLPTFSAARSNCFIFSGAFMALVYAPHSFCEIRVVRRDLARHRASQQLQLGGRGPRRLAYFLEIEIESGGLAHLGEAMPGMDALQAKAPLVPAPREERLAGEERLRAARSRDELHLRHEHALRVLLAEENHAGHRAVQVGRAERAGEAAALRLHQVDIGRAVDLRAAEEEDI